MNPTEVILKFHGGNKKYPIPTDSGYEFASLDKALSKKKIILLVQIGKEGWDCRSLTGIILSQEGDCSTNMVLQTSCRCLRQVEKGIVEGALIYLNESNAKTLNLQLQQQHRINLDEFQKGATVTLQTIKRYDRTKYLKLPKVDFHQLKINYRTVIEEKSTDISAKILKSADNTVIKNVMSTSEMTTELHTTGIDVDETERGKQIANFNYWVNQIVKESFGFLKHSALNFYNNELKTIFEKITYLQDETGYFSSLFNQSAVRANIRNAFYAKRSFETTEELIPDEASLLHVENFTDEVKTTTPKIFTPDADTVEKIIADDKGKLGLSKAEKQMLELAKATNNTEIIKYLSNKSFSHSMKDNSYHYLPYKTDSDFEVEFLDKILTFDILKELNLEIYYNGDRALKSEN